MTTEITTENGWTIKKCPDGSYGIFDSKGLVAGPFESAQEALEMVKFMPSLTAQPKNDHEDL